MFEYITLILQIVLVAVIATYIGKRLFFMCLDARRDHLWACLAKVECDILEQRLSNSIEAGYADCLLQNTKRLRGDSCETKPDAFMSAVFTEWHDKMATLPDDQKGIVEKILSIRDSLRETNSTIAHVIMQIFKRTARECKKFVSGFFFPDNTTTPGCGNQDCFPKFSYMLSQSCRKTDRNNKQRHKTSPKNKLLHILLSSPLFISLITLVFGRPPRR